MKFSKIDVRVFNAFCLVAEESQYRTDITMTKIAEKMRMSRQGLTKIYFKNVNEIVSSLHYYVNEDVRESLIGLTKRKPKKLLDGFVHEILPLLYSKRDYLAVLYGKVADPAWLDFLEETYFDILAPYFTVEGKDENFSNFVLHVTIRQVISILSTWLTSPVPESPVTFSEKFIYLTNHSTHDLLENIQQLD